MKVRHIMISAGLLALSVSSAMAQGMQQQPSPEQMKQMMQITMQATMGAMIAAMGPMTEAVIETQLNVAARPETADRLATFKRNLYDALIKKGFKDQDALQIVLVATPPSASPSTK